jgi:hypothetical protein
LASNNVEQVIEKAAFINVCSDASYNSKKIKKFACCISALIKAFDQYTLNPEMRDMASTVESVSQFYSSENGVSKISVKLQECYNFMVSMSSLLYFSEQGNEVHSSNSEITKVLKQMLRGINAYLSAFDGMRNEPYYNYMITEGQFKLEEDPNAFDCIYQADADLATAIMKAKRHCEELLDK